VSGRTARRRRRVGLLAPAAAMVVSVLLLLPATAGARPSAAALTQTLTVIIDGSGSGHVFDSWGKISCSSSCSADYESGTDVLLFAPADSPGSVFAGWSGECTGMGSCDVIMDQARTVTATFAPAVQHTLYVTDVGTGSGTVTSSPSGIDCGANCTADFADGSTVTLTATADSGSAFAGWGGDCSGTDSCVLTMDTVKSVQAAFDTAAGGPALHLDVSDYASGSITILPAGTDVPVLSGTIPGGFTLAKYLSGCNACATGSAPPNGYGFSLDPISDTSAANFLDRRWLQASATPVVWKLASPSNEVFVFPTIDHGPVPHEALETTVWGSNDPDAPFPDGWTLALPTKVYADGWIDVGADEESDDWASVWQFPDGHSFQYVAGYANFSVLIDPGGFLSDENEIDAVASATPQPSESATVESIDASCAGDVVTAQAIAAGAVGSGFSLALYRETENAGFVPTGVTATFDVASPGSNTYSHDFDVSALSASSYKIVSSDGVESNVVPATSCGPGSEIPESPAALLLPLSLLGLLGIATGVLYVRRRSSS
jgi:hypothetical protein